MRGLTENTSGWALRIQLLLCRLYWLSDVTYFGVMTSGVVTQSRHEQAFNHNMFNHTQNVTFLPGLEKNMHSHCIGCVQIPVSTASLMGDQA